VSGAQPHPVRQVLGGRRAGLLLHPTSLPGPLEQGDLGPEAYRFVEFLARSGLSVWQTLPLGPTHEDFSPYQCLSVHAGNPRLINPDLLVEWGWLGERD
jgi:4-alpha-glucanotransferase